MMQASTFLVYLNVFLCSIISGFALSSSLFQVKAFREAVSIHQGQREGETTHKKKRMVKIITEDNISVVTINGSLVVGKNPQVVGIKTSNGWFTTQGYMVANKIITTNGVVVQSYKGTCRAFVTETIFNDLTKPSKKIVSISNGKGQSKKFIGKIANIRLVTKPGFQLTKKTPAIITANGIITTNGIITPDERRIINSDGIIDFIKPAYITIAENTSKPQDITGIITTNGTITTDGITTTNGNKSTKIFTANSIISTDGIITTDGIIRTDHKLVTGNGIFFKTDTDGVITMTNKGIKMPGQNLCTKNCSLF